jgi:choline dehydrogenase-like flavoprotein
MNHTRDHQEFDAIVVGSGAAGSWAAKDLSEGGLRVLLLDAGREIDPAKDYPAPEVGNPLLARLGAILGGQHYQARSLSFGNETKHFYINDRQNPYEFHAKAPFLWVRGRQVGGRLHTWGRSALRMSDRELRGPRELEEMVWPIGYAELAPHYQKIEETLGVHGNRDGLENVPDGSFVAPHHLNPAEQLFASRLRERTGLRLIHNRVIRHNPSRIPIPITLGLRTGRLTIRPDSVVSHVITDRTTGEARGVGYYHRLTKQYREVYARVVVLCASALESVRILLNSVCPKHPEGIGGSSGVLGRYVCDHVMIGKGGPLSTDYLNAEKTVEESDRQPAADPYDFGIYAMYLPNFCGTWGPKPDFIGGYGVQIGCRKSHWWALAFGEMAPRFENRILLSKRRKDTWGIPAARIEVRHSENEDRMVDHIRASLAAIAKEVGLAENLGGEKTPRLYQRWIISLLKGLVLTKNQAFWPGASTHEIGGARMGSDPARSVVNPYCQVWDAPNLFVTDGACFVSSGFQSHTLSIMAITARACEFIVREYANGPT